MSELVNQQCLPAGTRIEEFVIERVLGSGGFGITYLARDVRLDRQVVIKENLPVQFCFRDTHSLAVAPRHTSGEDAENFMWSLENFSKEAAMLASLDHPGIVKVLRSFEAFGTAYFVMPFVEGLALDELAKERQGKPFNEEELRGLLDPLLDALGYLHDRGIYHRDIKPGNILMTTDGNPVLIDFGSARQRLSERSMTVVESAGYTPFEQLQSRGNVGPWSDLYALAATVVKVMIGEAPPKANDRTMGDPWLPLAGRGKLKDHCSHDFLQCLDRALKLPIEERWQGAEEFKKALANNFLPAAVAADATKTAMKPEDLPRLKNWQRVTVWLLCLGLMIAVGTYGYWQLGKCEVLIGSNPPGADVIQDGHFLGKTPVLLAPLPPFSDWQVELRMDGYELDPIRGRVVWRERSEAPLRQLRALPQMVSIISEPPGAEVLDGEKSLGITPWESAPIAVGTEISYHLRLRGYLPEEVRSEVLPRETRMVPLVTLRPQPQKVVVTSEPSGAEILEGEEVIGITPWESAPIAVGTEISYRLRLRGYLPDEVRSEVLPRETRMVHLVTLRPQPQKVVVTSEPSGAEILEGEEVLGSTPWEGDARDVGSKVTLTLRKTGYQEANLRGEVALNNPLLLHGALATKLQVVKVTSEPPGAEVREAGSFIGNTPLERTMKPGTEASYLLRLEGYKDVEVVGAVKAGEVLTLTAALKPLSKITIDLTDLPKSWILSQGNAPFEYAYYFTKLRLKSISPQQVIKTHAKAHGSIWNTLPPKIWWARMGYTLRVADRIALEMNVSEVEIISAFRSPAYNVHCGSPSCDFDGRRSWHQANVAITFVIPGKTPEEVTKVSKNLRDRGLFKGAVGTHGTSTYLDTRGENIDL